MATLETQYKMFINITQNTQTVLIQKAKVA